MLPKLVSPWRKLSESEHTDSWLTYQVGMQAAMEMDENKRFRERGVVCDSLPVRGCLILARSNLLQKLFFGVVLLVKPQACQLTLR